MTPSSASAVAPGRPYHVRACRGRVPAALADFQGETDFVLSTGTGTTVIRGIGAAQGDVVRFREKDVAHDGEYVRVWHITVEADGGFTAATGPSAIFALRWPLQRGSFSFS
jgi:hypothetical protein